MKWWWISTLALFVACNTNTTAENNNTDNDSTIGIHAGATDTISRSSIALQDGCFEMIMKRDTATLSLRVQDTLIQGELNYRWAEKDHNKGTINGTVQDSFLIADYTFESEGLTSVRKVVFKLKGDTLLQGYGELSEQNGKTVFTQIERLQFDTAFPFVRVNCQQLHR